VRLFRGIPSGGRPPCCGDSRMAWWSQRPGRRTTPRRRGQVTSAPGQLSGRQWRATALQAPGEPEQHLATACLAPSWIDVLGVGALSDDAVTLALAHKPAYAGRPADPRDQTHRFIVRAR
jgi:hypothetical protein